MDKGCVEKLKLLSKTICTECSIKDKCDDGVVKDTIEDGLGLKFYNCFKHTLINELLKC